jgi:hypothetical protein
MVQPTSFSLLSEQDQPPSLVVDLIPLQALTLFTGSRESGKTILALLLAQGVATRFAFLTRPCAQCRVAFFSRYGTKLEISQLVNRIAPKLMPTNEVQVPVFGFWEPNDTMPEFDDELLETRVTQRYFLIIDGIPDPKPTEEANSEEFLRKAQRLARKGLGVALFGSEEWRSVQSIKNRVDVHFPIAKVGDRITVDVPKTGRRACLDLPHREAFPFQIAITVE